MAERILIAGCGDVGNALGRRLIDDGCEVWGVRRTISALADGIAAWPIDLTDSSSLSAPPAPFDRVFYTASADRRDEASYRAIYVEGLRNLVALLGDTGSPLRSVIFTSSTAVYGQNRGEWVDERSQTEPIGFNGRVLLDAEAIVRNLPGGIVLRLSGIYGPGRTRLLRQVWQREAESTSSWTNRIHVEDCGAALHHLMQIEAPHSVYLGSDDEPATTEDVLGWMSERMGLEPPPRTSTARLNKRCRNTRLRESGFTFRYPTFREGYEPMIDEFLRAHSHSR